MRKGNSIVVAIIAAIIIIGGGYAIFHKSSPKASTQQNSSAKTTAPAVNNAVLITKTDSSLGQYLADSSGKALYTYNADTSGVSNCSGACLMNWPAYVDKGATTGLPSGVGTITRKDNGQIQYTYNGLPLYYFASDSTGKVTGNGVENFKVATPAASSSSSSSSTSNSSSSSSSTPNYNY
jgi:predicted lipoprotein with Yx(FWY)xxD motif